MTRTMKLLVLAGAGAIAAGGVAWAVRHNANAEGRTSLAGPDAAEARELVAPGLVEADGDVVQLAFETTGRVTEVLVDEGARAHAGQALVRLDDRLARAQLAKAEASLRAAAARRDAAQRGSRADEIRAARADADAARAQAADRELQRRRAERLAASDAIAAAQADTERSQAEAARAQADAADARLALVRAGGREELRREAQADVDAAQAEVEAARTRLSQLELLAPRDGVILRRLIEPGEQVTNLPPTVVLTMADADHPRLRAEIDESDVGHVKVGMTGFATAEAWPERRFPGHVERLSGELGRKKVRNDDPRARIDTRVLEVIFVFDDARGVPLGLRMDLHLPDAVRD
jgi:HlyD family secretion protein